MKRVEVLLADEEAATLEATAEAEGLRSISALLRVRAGLPPPQLGGARAGAGRKRKDAAADQPIATTAPGGRTAATRGRARR